MIVAVGSVCIDDKSPRFMIGFVDWRSRWREVFSDGSVEQQCGFDSLMKLSLERNLSSVSHVLMILLYIYIYVCRQLELIILIEGNSTERSTWNEPASGMRRFALLNLYGLNLFGWTLSLCYFFSPELLGVCIWIHWNNWVRTDAFGLGLKGLGWVWYYWMCPPFRNQYEY